MLEKGVKSKGTARELAKAIGVSEQHLSAAKSGKRGIPEKSCALLAQVLDLELGVVVAAKELWLAKSEEDKEFWLPFARAAGFAGICAAIVTLYVSPTPANAGVVQVSDDGDKSANVYYVK